MKTISQTVYYIWSIKEIHNLKAWELQKHMQGVGSWVNWENTVDKFQCGNQDSEVKGIAVSWMPTFTNVQKALDADCNLFVTHEPLYAVSVDEKGKIIGGSPFVDIHLQSIRGMTLKRDDVWVKKYEWLMKTGIIVYRCHDFWDDFPGIGIHGAWADWLGFTGEPVASKKFYEVHEVGSITVNALARKILSRVKPLGQDVVHVVGDGNKKVSRIAVGTGAITNYREMYSLGADVLLITDDGTRLWESGQWSQDTGVPIIVVNHSTSEEPGMKTLTLYIQKQFPNVPVKYIATGCIYGTIK
jgi:putative NIF3 family GTP cyclohydrolase 1 type 2